eukprot:scaffold112498_cov20-Tisochrysis_lutea.AAC.3
MCVHAPGPRPPLAASTAARYEEANEQRLPKSYLGQPCNESCCFQGRAFTAHLCCNQLLGTGANQVDASGKPGCSNCSLSSMPQTICSHIVVKEFGLRPVVPRPIHAPRAAMMHPILA